MFFQERFTAPRRLFAEPARRDRVRPGGLGREKSVFQLVAAAVTVANTTADKTVNRFIVSVLVLTCLFTCGNPAAQRLRPSTAALF